jgi:hypothetical protein
MGVRVQELLAELADKEREREESQVRDRVKDGV